MKFYLTIAAAILAVSQSSAFTPDEVSRIVETSPELKAAKAIQKAEAATSSTLNNLSNPELEFEHQWGTHGIGKKWGFSISQGFDWPGVYHSRSQAAAASRAAGRSLYDAKAEELAQRVKLLLIDLCYVNKEIELTDSIRMSLTQLGEKYRTGFSRGETSILDVKKIELELINADRQYNSLLDRRTEIEGELRGINPAAEWAALLTITSYPAMGPILSENEYADAMRLNNPQKRYLTDMETLSKRNQEVVSRSNLPGFSIGYRHDYELGEKFNGVSVGMTLPIFSGRNKSKAAALETMTYTAAIESQDAQLGARWKAMREQALRLRNECDDYRNALNSADTRRLLKLALDGGEISLLTYLQENAYFLQATREYLSVEHQLQSTLAELNRYVE